MIVLEKTFKIISENCFVSFFVSFLSPDIKAFMQPRHLQNVNIKVSKYLKTVKNNERANNV